MRESCREHTQNTKQTRNATNSVVALQDHCNYKAPATNHHIKRKVIAACELYCCLMPQCEALRICRLITTKRCCDQDVKVVPGAAFTNRTFRFDRKARAACAQSFALLQQATIEITRRNHSIIASSRHMYMGVIHRAHPVRGESHIQRNANGEVAALVPTCQCGFQLN